MKVLRRAGIAGMVTMLTGMLCFVLPGAANGAYPERPITVVVPYAPGGGLDLAARALADSMEKHLKQPLVILNKPGGATTIGGNTVVMAKPDGYTLGYFPTPTIIPEVFSYFYEAPYSSRDLRAICQATLPVLTISVKEGTFKSLKELVEYVRKQPGAKMGTHGKSGLAYIVMTTIAKSEKIKLIDVPFAGDSAIIPAILGDHITVGNPGYAAIKALVEAKKIRPLALILDRKVDFAPEVPTVVDLGYKLGFLSSHGFFGPKDLPGAVVKTISEVVEKVAAEKEFRTKIWNTSQIIDFQGTDTYTRTIEKDKEVLKAFFREEGFVKQ
ncbi:MAG: tripartite tricarboxylate transporter substrate binding protein [Deltaproteobacteria bacterium]|nr:tripartite tricarboxylate transporter substrate binding protein [Deltaproteobacteria bacterium]